MNTTEQQARVIQTPRTERKGNILAFWLSSTDHKIIGHLYLITSFFFFLCAGIMALIMRIQLLGPDQHIVSDQQYNELFTMHGTLMLLDLGLLVEGVDHLVADLGLVVRAQFGRDAAGLDEADADVLLGEFLA